MLRARGWGTITLRDVGGLHEPVEASGGGIVYRSDDQLTAALRRFRSDPALAVDLGRRAHELNWTPRVHLDRYLDLVRRCGAG